MEWVETTGRTIEEAKDAALDQLGVDEQDAEFEILAEAKPGLFGRLRTEARVRARVRPATPRTKDDRRRKRSERPPAEAGEAGAPAAPAAPAESTADRVETATATMERPAARNGRRDRQGAGRTEGDGVSVDDEAAEVPLERQGEVASDFLHGLVERFGADATVATRAVDEDTIEVSIEGTELGFLIGPRGGTLQALQELARTVVQRKTGARTGWVTVDVGGYKQRRKDALQRFTREVAQQVKDSGSRKALEPMPPGDRKIVHDTVNEIDGVTTTSEGEEPRRRVVLLPEG